jgi:shikimate kinase
LQSATATRPLLNTPGIDLEATIRELMERRGAYYGLAHYRVETDMHDPEDVARSIATLREAYE